ncbi:hypothetical protein CPB84DRAFT_1968005 [Gymnopilus junonius]|uniref:Uncharacterized protein n=1 Tax=Gymnopilus junonius TaxID=109634 RepID=A0A9P5N9S4_GYMJU|nr:hypothetical protein CPB84DRAFT_1968005 [Gymnopilus junonius]
MRIRYSQAQGILESNPGLADFVKKLKICIDPGDVIDDGLVRLVQQFNSVEELTVLTWAGDEIYAPTQSSSSWCSRIMWSWKALKKSRVEHESSESIDLGHLLPFGHPVQPHELRVLSGDEPSTRMLQSRHSNGIPAFDLTKVTKAYLAALDDEKGVMAFNKILEDFLQLETLTVCYTEFWPAILGESPQANHLSSGAKSTLNSVKNLVIENFHPYKQDYELSLRVLKVFQWQHEPWKCLESLKLDFVIVQCNNDPQSSYRFFVSCLDKLDAYLSRRFNMPVLKTVFINTKIHEHAARRRFEDIERHWHNLVESHFKALSGHPDVYFSCAISAIVYPTDW